MIRVICLLVLTMTMGFELQGRCQDAKDSLLENADLNDCIRYALQHQPYLQQSILDEEITERQIKTRLADWYPQVNFDYNLQHYFQLPTSVFGADSTGKKRPVKAGVVNSSTLGFSLNQAIFNRDVLLASRTAADVRKQVRQATESNKIDVVTEVSRAFYDVLSTQQQIALLEEDIIRLQNSLKVAYQQYQGGLVDKVDYKRATISLNNALAQRKATQESLKAKLANLKNQMGYPVEASLTLQYDSTQMERDAMLDTLQTVNYQNRIEFQLLQTQIRLQQYNLKYYKWGFLPSLSAFANYNLAYLNDKLGHLYDNTFPNSYAGFRLSFPIFQGTRRTQQIRQAELELQRTNFDLIALKNNVNTEYVQAMSAYKSNLVDYNILKENVAIAEEVYNTIQLQYKAGVKTYLDVIIAETDLRTAQVNYQNALFNILSSKLDVQRALGTIQF